MACTYMPAYLTYPTYLPTYRRMHVHTYTHIRTPAFTQPQDKSVPHDTTHSSIPSQADVLRNV